MYSFLLDTPRLRLRELRAQDRAAVAAILQDAAVMYAWEGAFSDQEVDEWLDRNWLRYRQDGFSYWAAVDKSSGRIIGLAGLLSEKAGDESNIGVGYIFAKEYWRQGYAYECAAACVEYAFATLGLKEVTAQIRPDNIASRKVAEKLGMTVRATFDKYYHGKTMPHLLYACQRKDHFK